MSRAWLIVVLTCIALPARADTPWAEGVPSAQQDQANALFDEGNALFAQQAHAPALAKYEAALLLWDHPLIRFNLAVTLIRLDRPLEAADELDRALRFGARPFKPDLYQQALDYQRLLQGRVGDLEASCTQAGTKVTLDGAPWFTCPGTRRRRVIAGEHAVSGELATFLPASQRIVVAGGATAHANLELVPLASAVRLEYRYRRWVPYTVTGAGAAIAIGGLLVYLAGRSQMSSFETNVARICPRGCAADLSDQPLLRDQRDAAQLKGTVGLTLLLTGGAVTAGGVVFVILNRPRRVLPDLELHPTAGGVTASTSWAF